MKLYRDGTEVNVEDEDRIGILLDRGYTKTAGGKVVNTKTAAGKVVDTKTAAEKADA